MMYDWLVVGAGFTGAVLAERIATVLDKRVLVIDRRPHVGGNAYDEIDAHGVLVHRYGPHIFHTNAPRIVDYLSQFTQWTPYQHRVRGLVGEQFVPIPFNFTSIEAVFGPGPAASLCRRLADAFGAGSRVPVLKLRESTDPEIRRVADVIYEQVFLHYTIKQWGMDPTELDASVSARVPVQLSRDDRYFQDSFQAMPAEGYTALFRRLLSHPKIEVRLNTGYADIAATEPFDRMVYTGSIDEFFDHVHGPLPYRSLRFELRSQEGEGLVQPCAVLNYPTPADVHPFTRVTEFRHLTGQEGVAASTVAVEFPEPFKAGVNEPYYPVPRPENRALFQRYAELAGALKTVVFAGRLADYSYFNMDQAVGRGLAAFEKQVAIHA